MPPTKISERSETTRHDASEPRQTWATVEDIAGRAYDLYVARGAEDGHDVEDWLQAERELNESPRSPRG